MFGVALLMSALVALGGARVFERCELARELLRLGVRRDSAATWVCIAYHESRFDTAARNPHSGDHGLLQISELYWCGPGKACGAPCSAFRDDDIADDVRCALRIHEEHTRLQGDGFLAWVVYPHHCRHNAKKYLADCDTSTKNVKFDDRARNIKTLVRNITQPQYVTRPDIDKLQPPYLNIKKLFQDNYANEFERNYYDNKKPMNWINFKINNIDELKLPNFNNINNHNLEFTTLSTTTTARNIDPELIGIKPPSPRKIESNQFRRRNMNLDVLSPKTISKDNYSPPKTNVQSYSSTNVQGSYLNLSHNPFLRNIAILSTEPPDSTARFSSYSTNPTLTTPTTTAQPAATTTATRSTYSENNVRTQNINLYTSMPNSVTPRRGRSRYVPQLSDFGYYKTTQRPAYSRSPDKTTAGIIDQKLLLNISNENQTRTSSTYSNNIYISSTELVPYTTPFKNPDTTQYEVEVTSRPVTTTTTKPTTTTRSYSRSTWSTLGNSRTTTLRPVAHASTERVTTTSTVSSTASQHVTRTPTEAPSTTPRRVTTEATPTVRSTQSIFDLYLNPTRATIKPFKFAPFGNSPFKLSIFSGGTTTAPPSFANSKRNNN